MQKKTTASGETDPYADLDGVIGRSTADDFLGVVGQHHVQLSAMADVKANIIITASSIVLTLALSHFEDPGYRTTVMLLLPFVTLALLFAVIAVLPKHRIIPWTEGAPRPAKFNLMFFGHFAELPRQRYVREMAKLLKDDRAIYEAMLEDIYGIGHYLDAYKYRYLRWSYLCFLIGFLLAAVSSCLRLVL
ncbi:MAG TPA: Pycsar system effector family protein [Gammaproteobacteria bacterium]